ncbi:MAG: NAD-dependent epimerase/dehydratase family protein [Acetobacterium woodii]|nr:NAD-dependent epimerase/dehydratase family protein [Acetobacterium woodii]MBI5677202.1 NAD-dependent epimerase/dehydratase family protein [Planctomycetota bacterium]
MKKKVLITGGAGFIGSHTADLLINRGYEVIIYDKLHSKTHNGKWPSYINPAAIRVYGDVQDREKMVCEIKKVNYIIHLAAEMDLNPDFQLFMDVNVGGTALIYELIVKNNLPIEKIIVASSQFVYGEGEWECPIHGRFQAPIRNKNKMLQGQWDHLCPKCSGPAKYCKNIEYYQNPPNHYALSKYFQEKLALQLGRLYSIPSVAMRYSIVHGPRQSLKNTYSGALRTFAINLLLNRPLATFEDNKSLRDFVSVFDVANANMIVLEAPDSNYQIYNVGGEIAWSIDNLAKVLADKIGCSYSFSFKKEFRIGDIRHAVSDISKIKKLGWKPIYSEEDTLSAYVDWIKNQEIDANAFIQTQKLLRHNNIIMTAK